MEKLPPLEKTYEAMSAIADGRVRMAAGRAAVASSDGAKEYTVTWDGNAYTSNDNATYWQGYAGYPVIAVLMLQGKLPLDKEIAAQFSGVNWAELNKKYKRDYAKAAGEAMRVRGIDAERAAGAAERVMDGLKKLAVSIKRGSLRPPKGKRGV